MTHFNIRIFIRHLYTTLGETPTQSSSINNPWPVNIAGLYVHPPKPVVDDIYGFTCYIVKSTWPIIWDTCTVEQVMQRI